MYPPSRREGNSIHNRQKRINTMCALAVIGLACLIWFYFSRTSKPQLVPAVHAPAAPVFVRPKRKNAPKSELAKKMNAKAVVDDSSFKIKPYGCGNKVFLNRSNTVIRHESDWDCDGVIDECRTEEQNEYGEMVRIEYYDKCGPEPNLCIDLKLNKFGEEIGYDYDDECDGQINNCTKMIRNDHGDIVEQYHDKGCDGNLEDGEFHRCSEFEYDDAGLPFAEKTGDCGKPPKFCNEYKYDENTGIRQVKYDKDCDSTPDSCYVEIYREDSRKPDTFSFSTADCQGPWKSCNLFGVDREAIQTIKNSEFCAKKYEEFVKKYQETR